MYKKQSAFFNHKHSEETKAKMSARMIGKFAEKHPRAVKVFCIELNKKFDSIESASKETKTDRNGISAVINGRQQTAGGYHWRYV